MLKSPQTLDALRCIKKAKEFWDEADIMIDYRKKIGSVSQIYYCAMYCAKGLLIVEGIKRDSHASIIGDFGKLIILNKNYPKKFGRFLNKMYDKRDKAVYSTSPYKITRKQIKELLKTGNEFILSAEKYIQLKESN